MKAWKTITLLLFCFSAQAQDTPDLYSIPHRKQFAAWLVKRQEFKLASLEMARLYALYPQNDSITAGFLYTSRQAGNFRLVEPAGPWSRYEYSCMLLQTDSIRQALGSISHISAVKPRLSLLLAANLLQKEYILAHTRADSLKAISASDFHYLVIKGQLLPHKSPWLAAGMSAIIPGSGKLYTREYEDGLYSMISIGLLAWQSIRAFKQEGIRSPLGWISGGIGFTFYTANIYGSAKSARRFNRKQWEQYRHEVHHDLLGVLH